MRGTSPLPCPHRQAHAHACPRTVIHHYAQELSTVVSQWKPQVVSAPRRYRRGAPRTAAKRSRTVAAVRSGGASQTSALKISTST